MSALQPAASGHVARAKQGQAPEPPEVTPTWDSLRAQIPIRLDGGGEARVGLQSSRAPISGGILLYCLAEGPQAKSRQPSPSRALGPFVVEIDRPGEHVKTLEELSSINLPLQLPGERLFAKTLVIHEPGEHRVTLTIPGEDAPAAEFVVQGIEADFHAWIPFGRAREGAPREEVQATEEDGYRVTLSALGSGAALPTHDGLMPVVTVGENEKQLADEPLPKLVPDHADPGLNLHWRGGGFALESDSDMIVARPDWHLLARWWVNGQAFKPEPAEQMADMNGLMMFGKKVSVDLQFDSAELGAAPGDRIALQVMHLPNGWSYTNESDELMKALHEAKDAPGARMSNRVEFVAP